MPQLRNSAALRLSTFCSTCLTETVNRDGFQALAKAGKKPWPPWRQAPPSPQQRARRPRVFHPTTGMAPQQGDRVNMGHQAVPRTVSVPLERYNNQEIKMGWQGDVTFSLAVLVHPKRSKLRVWRFCTEIVRAVNSSPPSTVQNNYSRLCFESTAIMAEGPCSLKEY